MADTSISWVGGTKGAGGEARDRARDGGGVVVVVVVMVD